MNPIYRKLQLFLLAAGLLSLIGNTLAQLKAAIYGKVIDYTYLDVTYLRDRSAPNANGGTGAGRPETGGMGGGN